MAIHTASTHPEAARSSRVAWIDRLRIGLTLLVVAHHAADTYATISDWYVQQPGQDAGAFGLTVFIVVNQAWFMGVFFLLSGLFVPGSADRKGLGRFTRDRLLRLGVPVLSYVLVIRPLCLIPAAIGLDGRAAAAGEPFSVAGFLAFGGDPGVTWFLEVLLVFTLGYLLVRKVGRFRALSRLRFGSVAGFVAVLAALTFGWQLVTPPGTYWAIGLPSPSFLPQYLLFFVAGLVGARNRWPGRLPRKAAIPAGLAVVVGVVLYAPTVGGPIDVDHLVADAASALGQALFAVGIAVLVVLLFRAVLDRPAGRVTRFLADQSMIVYLIHPAVLVGVAVALTPLAAPPLAKAALLLALGAPLSWGVGWLLRRLRPVAAIV
jgi:glucans biosynthesis protein C